MLFLRNEPRDQFDSLLRRLRKELAPVGSLETALVDKIASLLWRYRRLLVAERAEIQKAVAFPSMRGDHSAVKQVHIVVRAEGAENYSGLMQEIAGPRVSDEDRCLKLLRDLELAIKTRGFDNQADSEILAKLYGHSSQDNEKRTLFDSYRSVLQKAHIRGDNEQEELSTVSNMCVEKFLAELAEETRRLESYKSRNSVRCELEALCQNVPDESQLGRLLRYEASLERAFDRTLNQLERLQRMRLGQPVLPKLEVHHSLS